MYFSVDRQSCYVVRADELYNEVTQDASGKGASQGMFVGCFLDAATGLISFTCEGKETKHKFKVSNLVQFIFACLGYCIATFPSLEKTGRERKIKENAIQ